MRLPSITQRRFYFIIIISSIFTTLTWLSMPKHSDIIQDPLPMSFHSNSRLIPVRYWKHRSIYPERYTDSSCMKFPDPSDLKYAAASWQMLPIQNGSVYIYGAYWDPRFNDPLVRILIYCDVTPLPKLYCQLWFPDDNEPQTELATPVYGWRPTWGGPKLGVNEPYILTCGCRRHIPEREMAPVAVSVVTAPCGEATNVLDIQNAPFNEELAPHQTSHGNTSPVVCLRWMHYRHDISISLIEWLQLLKHFGADKVFIYVLRIHPNTKKVLKYYEHQGFVVVTQLDNPPQLSGLKQSRSVRDFRDLRRELLPLNDCLYRNILHYNWLLALDLDEIIVPPTNETWSSMIERLIATSNRKAKKTLDALVFRNFFVLDGAQKDLEAPAKARILAHTWRANVPNPKGSSVKSFVNTSSVIAMHNHMPMSCHAKCTFKDVDVEGPGRLLHFRKKCSYDVKDCPALHNVVKEDNLGYWREAVLKEIRHVLEILDLEPLE